MEETHILIWRQGSQPLDQLESISAVVHWLFCVRETTCHQTMDV